MSYARLLLAAAECGSWLGAPVGVATAAWGELAAATWESVRYRHVCRSVLSTWELAAWSYVGPVQSRVLLLLQDVHVEGGPT